MDEGEKAFIDAYSTKIVVDVVLYAADCQAWDSRHFVGSVVEATRQSYDALLTVAL